jgi:hypothetical protein
MSCHAMPSQLSATIRSWGNFPSALDIDFGGGEIQALIAHARCYIDPLFPLCVCDDHHHIHKLLSTSSSNHPTILIYPIYTLTP